MYSQRQCQTICPASADSFRFEIATSEKQIAPFSVHGSQCLVFTGFLCSNLSVWTCKSKAM